MQTFTGFFTGSSAGYFLANIFAGAETGQQGIINSLIFTFGDWQLHLHHWIISLVFLAILFLFVRKKYQLPVLLFTFATGFFIGMFVQGIINYDDWHQILYKI
ncbi:MAG: hypothetical protein WC302_02250 [Candidatus Paceibacterota bacterium]|jgi:uncharacterized membrane protein YczE